MNRESEYLPETTQPFSADQRNGVDTWIDQGIPGSFYNDPGIFFACTPAKLRIAAAENGAQPFGKAAVFRPRNGFRA